MRLDNHSKKFSCIYESCLIKIQCFCVENRECRVEVAWSWGVAVDRPPPKGRRVITIWCTVWWARDTPVTIHTSKSPTVLNKRRIRPSSINNSSSSNSRARTAPRAAPTANNGRSTSRRALREIERETRRAHPPALVPPEGRRWDPSGNIARPFGLRPFGLSIRILLAISPAETLILFLSMLAVEWHWYNREVELLSQIFTHPYHSKINLYT